MSREDGDIVKLEGGRSAKKSSPELRSDDEGANDSEVELYTPSASSSSLCTGRSKKLRNNAGSETPKTHEYRELVA